MSSFEIKANSNILCFSAFNEYICYLTDDFLFLKQGSSQEKLT